MIANLTVFALETLDEANLGALCRAMKNYGVRRLAIVSPRCEEPKSARARALACSADDILEAAAIYRSLEDALRGEKIDLLAGTTARRTTTRGPFLSPAEWAIGAMEEGDAGRRIGLLIGPEDTGLTTAVVDRCHWKISIPTGPDMTSLNMAQATVVILYSAWCVAQGQWRPEAPGSMGGVYREEFVSSQSGPEYKRLAARSPAPPEDIERVTEAMQDVAREARYYWPDNPAKTLRPFRQLLQRAKPTRREVGILLSFLRRIVYKMKHPAAPPLDVPGDPRRDEAT